MRDARAKQRSVTMWLRAAATALVAIAMATAACAAESNDAHPFSEGWRTATVERVVQGHAIADPAYWRCIRERVGDPAWRQREWVELRYRLPGKLFREVVPRPAGIGLKPGDCVRVNVNRCDDAIVR